MRAVPTVRGAVVVLWVLTAVPAAAGQALPALSSPYGDALHGTAAEFSAFASAGLWAAFTAIGAVLLLPGAFALTAARIAVPANAVATLWAAYASDDRSWAGHGLALAAGLAAAVAVMLPAFGEAMVDAGSYGDEHRFLLRPPGPVMVAMIVPMWVVAVAGSVTGPLLLADRRWTVGVVAAAAGMPAAALAVRSLHRLARRWLVFVPKGMVIRDHMAVAQPLPVSRRGITCIGPAPTDTDAVDLTVQAFGMALELRLSEPVSAYVVSSRGKGRELSVATALISPSRPAAVMATAVRRGIAISPPSDGRRV